MSKFTVTSAQLNATASELVSLDEQFKTAVSKLEQSEAQLNAQWDGDANDAFHRAFAIDKQKMTEFYNLIISYVDSLDKIRQRYDTAEATNLETARSRNY
ncbi:MAG: WXG100 family type VII secretion target [Oscillospiraceae bacterium]